MTMQNQIDSSLATRSLMNPAYLSTLLGNQNGGLGSRDSHTQAYMGLGMDSNMSNLALLMLLRNSPQLSHLVSRMNIEDQQRMLNMQLSGRGTASPVVSSDLPTLTAALLRLQQQQHARQQQVHLQSLQAEISRQFSSQGAVVSTAPLPQIESTEHELAHLIRSIQSDPHHLTRLNHEAQISQINLHQQQVRLLQQQSLQQQSLQQQLMQQEKQISQESLVSILPQDQSLARPLSPASGQVSSATADIAPDECNESLRRDMTSQSDHSVVQPQCSDRKRKGRIGSFPQKLHQMLVDLERECRTSIASFLPHGRAFAIHKPDDFVKSVMHKYFRMGRFSSFQRQLNLYDFKRITDGCDKGAYFHELFVKAQPSLCYKMKRIKIKGVIRKNEKAIEIDDPSSSDEESKHTEN